MKKLIFILGLFVLITSCGKDEILLDDTDCFIDIYNYSITLDNDTIPFNGFDYSIYINNNEVISEYNKWMGTYYTMTISDGDIITVKSKTDSINTFTSIRLYHDDFTTKEIGEQKASLTYIYE